MTTVTSKRLIPLSFLVLGALGLAAAAYVTLPARTERQFATIGGPFALTTPDGRLVTEADLKGHPFLVFFGYTHCPDTCPTSLFEISEVFKAMGPDKKVAALFITIDPERDTPAALKEYVSSFDPRIIGLSGDAPRLEAVEKAYRVYAKKVPEKGPGRDGEYTMDHTAIVYLMDKDGRFVNAFNLERPPTEAAKELEKYL
jgi:protein SCO1/2